MRDGFPPVVLGAEHVLCPTKLAKRNVLYLIGTETEYCYTAELIFRANYDSSRTGKNGCIIFITFLLMMLHVLVFFGVLMMLHVFVFFGFFLSILLCRFFGKFKR